MIRYHETANNRTLAEILPGTVLIKSPDDMLDIMAETGYNGSNGIIVHSGDLDQDFFDLKSGLAGEILQKFSNYRMRLAIVGNFSNYKSKSLKDLIRESNKMGTIYFVDSTGDALLKLSR